jgi:hypothetical protein
LLDARFVSPSWFARRSGARRWFPRAYFDARKHAPVLRLMHVTLVDRMPTRSDVVGRRRIICSSIAPRTLTKVQLLSTRGRRPYEEVASPQGATNGKQAVRSVH